MWNNVKEEYEAGSFNGHEVWIGIDSKVSEKIWHRGGYTDKELYEIMLEMWEIARKQQFLLHLIHVAVSRLICCGVDGPSHGNLQLEKLDE